MGVLKSNWERRWRDLVAAGGAAIAMGCSTDNPSTDAVSPGLDAADPGLDAGEPMSSGGGSGGGTCNGSPDPCCGQGAACFQRFMAICQAQGGYFDGQQCENSETPAPDSGTSDSSTSDSGNVVDAASAEAGSPEAGLADAGDAGDGHD